MTAVLKNTCLLKVWAINIGISEDSSSHNISTLLVKKDKERQILTLSFGDNTNMEAILIPYMKLQNVHTPKPNI